MIHQLITILTTVAVMLHAAFGCCAHHEQMAHVHVPGDGVVALHGHDHETHDAHGQQNLHAECRCSGDHDHHTPAPHPECDHHGSHFLATLRSFDDGQDFTSAMAAVSLFECVPTEDLLTASSRSPRLSHTRLASTSPLRAFMQVWRL